MAGSVQQKIRPKLLALLPRHPFPVVGGDRLRIHEVCRALSANFDITLVSLYQDVGRAPHDEIEAAVYSKLVPLYHPRWKSYIHCFLAIFTGEPFQIAYYRSSAFYQEVMRQATDADIVLCHLVRTMEYGKATEKPLIIEMTDAISMSYSRVKFDWRFPNFKNFVYMMEQRRLNRYEREAPRHADALVFVSDVDASYLYGADIPSNVIVCSNGVDLAKFPVLSIKKNSRKICFIGKMTSLQNQDAVIHFADDVLPLLRKQGDFVFKVVGIAPDSFRSRFIERPWIEFTGEVESVAEAASDCFCGVAPIRIGGGVKNKVLEYMALGLPVVSTPVGVEGIHVTPGEEVLVAAESDDFSSHVMHLFNDPDAALNMKKLARARVEEDYRWSELLEPFVSVALGLLESKRHER
jgi:glycosyltransferase involved in cell wall biosynthesis